MQVLQGQLSDDVLGQLSQQIGAEKEQTAAAANGIFASMLGGLANNAAASGGGLGMLGDLLDRDNDGSVLDDLMGMVMGGGQQQQANSGLGVLGSILGDRQEAAAQHIGQSSGLNVNQVMKLMPVLAPILMGVLGRTRNQGGLDLGSLAGIITGSAQNAQQGGFGDLLGNVLGGVMGGQQEQQQQQQAPQGGDMMAQILGGIFGR
jgi:hypothetical protein